LGFFFIVTQLKFDRASEKSQMQVK
jgi:hypothetical protein